MGKNKSKGEEPSADGQPAGMELDRPNDGLKPGTFWLTRIVYLRILAFIYLVAFLVAFHQNKELLGDNGLLPLRLYLRAIRNQHPGESNIALFSQYPTIFWWLTNPKVSRDFWLDSLALSGAGLSFWMLITGAANALAFALLWILYTSIVNVGQTFYGYGWESQLLETGFLAIWAFPLLTWRQMPKFCPPSWFTIVANRWLITRIMLGAGLIKIRGDECWRDLTCMNYFYETQPNPNPLSYYAHQAPQFWHKFETLGNHIVELVAPWLGLLPFRWASMTNGFVQILFQTILISTGNLSFLNWLTIVPSVWFFDDRFLARFFPPDTVARVAKIQAEEPMERNDSARFYLRVRQLFHWVLGGLIAYLSLPTILNLMSAQQVMNTSFEPFRIVNTYGAFGAVTKNRTEIILEATQSNQPDSASTPWTEYDFHCKPGKVDRAPCIVSPFHYRLDWQMWIAMAAGQKFQDVPWLVHLAGKMLENDEPLLEKLLSENPFAGKQAPSYVRASLYRYFYNTQGGSSQHWWRRERVGEYMPPMDLKMIKMIYKRFGWRTRIQKY